LQGLTNAAVRDARFNTAADVVFVDLRGLSPADAAHVMTSIRIRASGALNPITFLYP
jgi:hypothetical protein